MVREGLSEEEFDLRPDVEKEQSCDELISKTLEQRKQKNTQRELVEKEFILFKTLRKFLLLEHNGLGTRGKKCIWKQRWRPGKGNFKSLSKDCAFYS